MHFGMAKHVLPQIVTIFVMRKLASTQCFSRIQYFSLAVVMVLYNKSLEFMLFLALV
jgi:hypothetical protein